MTKKKKRGKNMSGSAVSLLTPLVGDRHAHGYGWVRALRRCGLNCNDAAHPVVVVTTTTARRVSLQENY